MDVYLKSPLCTVIRLYIIYAYILVVQVVTLLKCFYVLVCFRVVNQYHELVKSEAKCPVKMFHNSGGSINLSHLSPGKEMEVSLLSCIFFYSPLIIELLEFSSSFTFISKIM